MSSERRPAALVTGAAKRVGREMALALAKRGYDIGLHYNTSCREASLVQKEIEAEGARCVLLECDLASAPDVGIIVRQAKGSLPGLNLIVNNASIFEPRTLLDTSLQDFERNFGLHVRAPLFLLKEFAKLCGEGQAVNIVDAAVRKNDVNYFPYLLSKKSLLDLTQMAAVALGPNIRVNAIAPGSVAQPVDDDDPAYMEKRATEIPLKLVGCAQYLIQGLEYLLDNPFVTGECLFIDGGAHLGF